MGTNFKAGSTQTQLRRNGVWAWLYCLPEMILIMSEPRLHTVLLGQHVGITSVFNKLYHLEANIAASLLLAVVC